MNGLAVIRYGLQKYRELFPVYRPSLISPSSALFEESVHQQATLAVTQTRLPSFGNSIPPVFRIQSMNARDILLRYAAASVAMGTVNTQPFIHGR